MARIGKLFGGNKHSAQAPVQQTQSQTQQPAMTQLQGHNPLGLATLQRGLPKDARAPNHTGKKSSRFQIKYEAARHAARVFEIVCSVFLIAVGVRQDSGTVTSMGAYGGVSLAIALGAIGLVAVLVAVPAHFLHYFEVCKKTLTTRRLVLTEMIVNALMAVFLIVAFGLLMARGAGQGLCGPGVSSACDAYNWLIVFVCLGLPFWIGSTVIDAMAFHYGVRGEQLSDVEVAMTLRRMTRA